MKHPAIVTGWRFGFAKRLLQLQIAWIALQKYGDPIKAFQSARKLILKSRRYIGDNMRYKYLRIDEKYFLNFGIPAWPSKAFSRFVKNQFSWADHPDKPVLDTLLFGITKKCGFECEHCFEWYNLNKKEVLTRENILEIIGRFREVGVNVVDLSGGEPLNRFADLLYVLSSAPEDIEYWIYTNGFTLGPEKARALKEHGLTGVAISVDHYLEEKHDQFRGMKGSFKQAIDAAHHCTEAGLAVCFSLCTTGDMVSLENLRRYREMAYENGVLMIQLLEPKPVGHYKGKDVSLNAGQLGDLETFFLETNFNAEHRRDFPTITYHGFYSRRVGCLGGAKGYVYVDTDGYVNSCPFCQQQLYHALDEDLVQRLTLHKQAGCTDFPSRLQSNSKTNTAAV